MQHSRKTTRLLKRNTSGSKTWQGTNGFCLLDEFIQSFMTQSWTRPNVKESLRSIRTIFTQSNRQFTWYLKTCVIMRSDNDSRLANDFARSFLHRYAPQISAPKQMELSLSA